MAKGTTLSESFLEDILLKDKKKIVVYLVNGIKLQGDMIDFDDLNIAMTSERQGPPQLVNRAAISTIKPDQE